MELLQSNWLFLTLRKTGSRASFFFCNLLVKDYIKICKSVPGNWDATCCLVSTDISWFDNLFFFKLHNSLLQKTTQNLIDLMFLCQHTVLSQYFIVNCRSNNKDYNAHSRTRTKEVLRNVGRYEAKVLWSSFSQDIMFWESYIITQIIFEREEGSSAKEPGQE